MRPALGVQQQTRTNEALFSLARGLEAAAALHAGGLARRVAGVAREPHAASHGPVQRDWWEKEKVWGRKAGVREPSAGSREARLRSWALLTEAPGVIGHAAKQG